MVISEIFVVFFLFILIFFLLIPLFVLALSQGSVNLFSIVFVPIFNRLWNVLERWRCLNKKSKWKDWLKFSVVIIMLLIVIHAVLTITPYIIDSKAICKKELECVGPLHQQINYLFVVDGNCSCDGKELFISG